MLVLTEQNVCFKVFLVVNIALKMVHWRRN